MNNSSQRMNPKAGFFCHNGLGDGINCLVLSNILHRNGWRVDTYQNTMGALQSWIPHLPVLSYPHLEELPRILSTYDWYFVVHNDTDEFTKKLVLEGKRRFPDRMKVIYLYPSKGIINEPYYHDCLTDPTLSIRENLEQLAEEVLHFSKIPKGSVLIPPSDLIYRKYPNRVVIHPTSARVTRNWPKDKFVKLALHLRKVGYEPVFVPGTQEGWDDIQEQGLSLSLFPNLEAFAKFVYESGYLIGNDSGPGHLASSLGIPTLTICRRKAWAKMWAPSFRRGVVVTPSSWIPNIRGFRLRDREWKRFISWKHVQRAFQRLVKLPAE